MQFPLVQLIKSVHYPKVDSGEGSESALLYFMFPNNLGLPDRISLQEDWYLS